MIFKQHTYERSVDKHNPLIVTLPPQLSGRFPGAHVDRGRFRGWVYRPRGQQGPKECVLLKKVDLKKIVYDFSPLF